MVASAAGILAAHAVTFYSFGIFMRPLTGQFGWDRGALSAALSIGLVVAGPLSIYAGRLSDRYGPRLLVTASGIITGTAFILMSQVSELWHVYLIYGVAVAVGGAGCVVPVTSTIPRWFVRRRGIATSLTWTGIGIGGVVTPILAQWLISNHDWQTAYVVLGIINVALVTTLAQALKRDPKQMGIEPYGAEPAAAEPEEVTAAAGVAAGSPGGLSLREALRTRQFWLFAMVLFGFVATMQVVLAHLAPHTEDLGMTATVAATFVSVFAATSLIGRNLAGLVSDRIGAARTITIHLTATALALGWLLIADDAGSFYAFAAFYGIAYGGIVPMQTLLAGDLFGLRSLGIITATLMLGGSLGGGIGAPLAGAIFDSSGSYLWAFRICLMLLVLAIIGSVALRRPGGSRRGAPLTGDEPVA